MSGVDTPVLTVKDLVVEFKTEYGAVRALNGVSFGVHANETLALVGESGCGKSVTALAILGLIGPPNAKILSGSIRLCGEELVGKSESQLRRIRGKEVSIIFQDPMTALNPVYTIGAQMGDVMKQHRGLTANKARDKACEILDTIGIAAPAKLLEKYPHQLSGGMRQRVMIAMALSCDPKLLLADEPTTALDVTTQAQVLREFSELQLNMGTAVVLITHDLGVVAETCKNVLVMYCGRIIESTSTEKLFANPLHHYSNGLLQSIPTIRPSKLDRLPTIEGNVPELRNLPQGCKFAPRCGAVQDTCRNNEPELLPVSADPQSSVRCFYPRIAEKS